MTDFDESPEQYQAVVSQPWGVIEYGEGQPIRVTIMNAEVLAALGQLSNADTLGDEPEDFAADLVVQHMSKWLDDVRRSAE